MLLAAAIPSLFLISVAYSQVTVTVGSTADLSSAALAFLPNTITAPSGTVVTFKFIGGPGNHSVTQSTFADPCDPVPGGFDSGLVFIPTTGAGASHPEWNLTITDDTKPIWYYCKQLQGVPHCKLGMVGAINAPSSGDNTFATFQTNAENFANTPGQGPGGLVGIGASASAAVGPVQSPVIVYGGTPVSATPGTASNSSSAPTETGKKSSASGFSSKTVVATLAAALSFILA